ncbi:MAG: GNAT family N-acetyltransferase [Candidatus Zixiibacteriota bacterium]
MIHKLIEKEYKKVHSLFTGSHLNLVIDAVVEGNSPGQMWVDDVTSPKTAFMWDKAYCYYLVGSADNGKFNTALREFICGKLAPEAMANNRFVFKVYYTSKAWESKIEAIFGAASLRQRERVLYTSGKLKIPDWRKRIPSGLCIRCIDEELLTKTKMENIPAVVGEIESCWNSVDDFLRNGFGFCLVHDQVIACWCTAEYVSGNKCGIGIETAGAYRRRGFATLTACAFVDYCISNHILPHWDSWKDNLSSIAVAEKVGFKKTLEYTVYFGRF